MKDQKKARFFVLDDQTKDELAIKVINCLVGLTAQEIIDQLEFTKDFFRYRLKVSSIDDSVVVKEGRRLKKERDLS
jgi:hypothetical protein